MTSGTTIKREIGVANDDQTCPASVDSEPDHKGERLDRCESD